jgi:hypothetical protein
MAMTMRIAGLTAAYIVLPRAIRMGLKYGFILLLDQANFEKLLI